MTKERFDNGPPLTPDAAELDFPSLEQILNHVPQKSSSRRSAASVPNPLKSS